MFNSFQWFSKNSKISNTQVDVNSSTQDHPDERVQCSKNSTSCQKTKILTDLSREDSSISYNFFDFI